jgi:hypothetical protein
MKKIKAWAFRNKIDNSLAVNLDRMGWLYDLRPFNEKPKMVDKRKWEIVSCIISYKIKQK